MPKLRRKLNRAAKKQESYEEQTEYDAGLETGISIKTEVVDSEETMEILPDVTVERHESVDELRKVLNLPETHVQRAPLAIKSEESFATASSHNVSLGFPNAVQSSSNLLPQYFIPTSQPPYQIQIRSADNTIIGIPALPDDTGEPGHLSQHNPNAIKGEQKCSMIEMRPQNIAESGIVINKDEMSFARSTRLKSNVWYHFIKLDKSGKCRYCHKIISCSCGSFSNLKRHMKLKHPTIPYDRVGNKSKSSTLLPKPKSSDPFSSGIREILLYNPPQSTTPTSTSVMSTEASNYDPTSTYSGAPSAQDAQRSIKKFVNVTTPMTLKRNTDLDIQLLKMICKGFHPFTMVENQAFKAFVNVLCSNYTLPTPKHLSNTLLPSLHSEMVDKVKKDLVAAKAICLTSDEWTNVNGVFFTTITAHFIDDKTQLKSNLLECSSFEENHTEEDVSSWVKSVTEKFDIHCKIVAIIADDSSKMKSAASLLKFRHLPCFAHTLDKVVKRAIQLSIQKVVDEVKRTVMHFRRSSYASGKLTEIQKNSKTEILKLKDSVSSRWNSTYEMMRRFVLNKEAIISCLPILDSDPFNSSLTEPDWELIEQSIAILKVFDEVTKEMSSEEMVPLSKMSILLRLVSRQLKSYKEKNENVLPETNLLLNELLKGLEEQIGAFSDEELLTQATLLDPRFKKQGFADDGKFRECYNNVVLKMKALLTQQTQNQSSQANPDSSSSKSEVSSIWEEFDGIIHQLKERHDPGSVAIGELDKYLSEAYLLRNSHPLEWWESKKLLYPTLYELVLKILCVPATSVPCERIFSKAGLVYTDKRNRFTSSKISEVLFINND